MNNILKYYPKSGRIKWVVSRGQAKAGDDAGYLLNHHTGKEYKLVQVNGKPIYFHRLAWELHYGVKPSGQIDHIDGDSLNNRIENLRDVAHSENRRNIKMYKTNKTGVMGVSVFRGKFKACIHNKGVNHYLGLFESLFDACCARKSAERSLGFHVNHGGKSMIRKENK